MKAGYNEIAKTCQVHGESPHWILQFHVRKHFQWVRHFMDSPLSWYFSTDCWYNCGVGLQASFLTTDSASCQSFRDLWFSVYYEPRGGQLRYIMKRMWQCHHRRNCSCRKMTSFKRHLLWIDDTSSKGQTQLRNYTRPKRIGYWTLLLICLCTIVLWKMIATTTVISLK